MRERKAEWMANKDPCQPKPIQARELKFVEIMFYDELALDDECPTFNPVAITVADNTSTSRIARIP